MKTPRTFSRRCSSRAVAHHLTKPLFRSWALRLSSRATCGLCLVLLTLAPIMKAQSSPRSGDVSTLATASADGSKSVGRAVAENSEPLLPENAGPEHFGYETLPTARELIASVAALRPKLTEKIREYQRDLPTLEAEYRRSPHRPAIWRAKLFAEIEAKRAALEELRRSLEGDLLVWSLADVLKSMLETHSEEQLKDRRLELLAYYSDADGLIDRQWLIFYDQTPLELITQPEGLIWTIESRFDGDNLLVVTGTTPMNEERFVGSGPGILRISCPGQPDYVQEVDLGLSPWDGVFAEVKFRAASPAR